jgi:tetratricopeptide (TPR) repeat protein
MARLTERLGVNRYDADEYYRQALDAYRKGKVTQAQTLIGQAMALLPSHAEYVAARGLMYLEEQAHIEARVDFEKALRLYPLEMLSHYGLGVIEYRENHYEAALAHLSEAYKIDPHRPETLYFLAIVYHRLANHEAARRLMQAALEAFPAADKRRADAQKWIKTFEGIIKAG